MSPSSERQTYAGTGWHHFAATFDDPHDTFKLYVDGVLAAIDDDDLDRSRIPGGGSNTVIGRHGNAARTTTSRARSTTCASTVTRSQRTEVAQLYGFIGRWKLSRNQRHDGQRFHRLCPQWHALPGTASWSTDCGGMGVFDFNGSTHVFTVANAADFQPTTMLSICRLDQRRFVGLRQQRQCNSAQGRCESE